MKSYKEQEAERLLAQEEMRRQSRSRFTNMTKDELFDWYMENARHALFGESGIYHVRICSEFLQSADTKDLWDAVQKLVKGWKT